MTDSSFTEHADPDVVFALLSNDTRIAILQKLWEADNHEATFSQLREAVEIRDSGQFNYHLNELVGRFVAKTEGGYELTQAGMQINGAIRSGAYTVKGAIDPIKLEEPCPTCGGDRRFHYEDETVRIECLSCPVGFQVGVPPAALAGRDREAIPQVAGRYLQTKFQHITNGFCIFCDGPVVPTVKPVHEIAPDMDTSEEDSNQAVSEPSADQIGELPLIQYTCQQCGAEPTIGLRIAFINHPAVVSFYYDHGVTIQDHPVWDFAGTSDHLTVQSWDPFRASVTYALDGDTLTLVTDEDLTIVEIVE